MKYMKFYVLVMQVDVGCLDKINKTLIDGILWGVGFRWLNRETIGIWLVVIGFSMSR